MENLNQNITTPTHIGKSIHMAQTIIAMLGNSRRDDHRPMVMLGQSADKELIKEKKRAEKKKLRSII